MHEDDVNLKGIAIFLGILAGTLVVVYGILTWQWRSYERAAERADRLARSQAPLAASVRPYFPFPREQPDPVVDLNALRAREQAQINSYGWINRTSGIVRIPVDRAIELVAQPAGGPP